MWIVIVGIMLAFVVPWVFFFLISYSTKIRATPIIEKIDLATAQDIDHKAFEEATQKLASKSFQQIGDFSIRLGPSAVQYARVFTDKNKVVLAICGYMAHGQVKNICVGFESEFEDGTQVTTSNSAYPRVFKYDKKKFEYQCPKVGIKDLLEFHQQRIAKIGQGKFPRLIPGNLSDTIIEDHKERMEKQEAFKTYKKERSGEFYRPTVYGAAYMAWNCWMGMFLRYNPQVVKIKPKGLPARTEEQPKEILPMAESLEQDETTVTKGTTTKIDIARENDSDDYILAKQESEKLEKQLSSGAGWFYLIAGLSLINTIIAISGSNWGFIVGLAITQIIDAVGHELGMVGIIISVVFDVTIAGVFVIFGIFANKKFKWAFITGMIVYGLDTLLVLAVQFWLALAFHIFVLYGIFNGYRAYRKLMQLQESGGEGDNKLSGETGNERD